jgi:hypothetical protein
MAPNAAARNEFSATLKLNPPDENRRALKPVTNFGKTKNNFLLSDCKRLKPPPQQEKVAHWFVQPAATMLLFKRARPCGGPFLRLQE